MPHTVTYVGMVRGIMTLGLPIILFRVMSGHPSWQRIAVVTADAATNP
jgi:hypothetical protein